MKTELTAPVAWYGWHWKRRMWMYKLSAQGRRCNRWYLEGQLVPVEVQPMTEAEWLACDNPFKLLSGTFHRMSERRVRLFALYACRLCPILLAHDLIEEALEMGERWLDGAATEEETRLARESINWGRGEMCESLNCLATAASVLFQSSPLEGVALETVIDNLGEVHTLIELRGRVDESYPAQCGVLRELVPFRAVTFAPEWRTDTAVSLARQMYDSRDFAAMPILADALQDAGCDNEDILTHCRDPRATHVRGCWVVDLVLAKE